MLYILIYIVVVQVIRPTIVFPQRELNSFKSAYKRHEKLVPARTNLCAPPVCHLLSGALFSNESAPAFHLELQIPMNFDHRFFDFSKSHWELHFSYVFDIALTVDQRCDP